MEIAFLMDSLESIDPLWETTSHLMYECNQRGHTVYFLEPHDVYIRNNRVVARMWNITVPPDLGMVEYWKCLIQCLEKDDLIFETLTDLDALFLRKNPPLNYQVMELLAPVNDQVFMINSTSGKTIFSRWETGRSCTISILRSSSVVNARITGGWIMGTSAMYEYAATAIAPSNSGASTLET